MIMKNTSTSTTASISTIDNSFELDSFVWPRSDCSLPEHGEFASREDVPVIDLASGSKIDEIGRACKQSGFFQVINHGVDRELISRVHANAREFFELPDEIKSRASRAAGNSFGFAGKFAGRFRSKCPWKETFSLQYAPTSNIVDYVIKVYSAGEYEQHCDFYETYCKEMKKLGQDLIELIAQSLELAPDALDEYFRDGFSIFRMNMYPPSQHFSQLLGTGPHTDPCALTILHQDEVGGLQVYNRDETWVTVEPRSDAFVISIGDTLQALCNHRYKSAKHRAVIHATRARHSLVFFINPGLETVIRPVPELLNRRSKSKNKETKTERDQEQQQQGEDQQQQQQQEQEQEQQQFIEFNWGQLLEFTQKHYRTDVHTLDAFESYLRETSQAA